MKTRRENNKITDTEKLTVLPAFFVETENSASNGKLRKYHMSFMLSAGFQIRQVTLLYVLSAITIAHFKIKGVCNRKHCCLLLSMIGIGLWKTAYGTTITSPYTFYVSFILWYNKALKRKWFIFETRCVIPDS